MTNYKRIGKIAIALLVVINLFLLIRTSRVWKRTSVLKDTLLSGKAYPGHPQHSDDPQKQQLNTPKIPPTPPRIPEKSKVIETPKPAAPTPPPAQIKEQSSKMDPGSVDVLKNFGKSSAPKAADADEKKDTSQNAPPALESAPNARPIGGGMPDDLEVIGQETKNVLPDHKDVSSLVDENSRSSNQGDGTIVRAEKVLAAFGKNPQMEFTLHRYHGEHRVPNAIIIGAARCGTHQLAAFLELHPSIYLVDGQTNFFNNKSVYAKGMEWYGSQMPKDAPQGGVIIERSPGYFYSEDAPKRVQAMNASIKLILAIRNPTQRTVSEYAQFVAKAKARNESATAFEALMIEPKSQLVNTENLAVIRSLYHVHLTRWLKYFSNEQILVVNGDGFAKNPFPELKRVEEFLGLPHLITEDMFYFNSTSSYFCLKKDGKPACYQRPPTWEAPEIDHEVLHKMSLFYKHHNTKLYSMIKDRMEW